MSELILMSGKTLTLCLDCGYIIYSDLKECNNLLCKSSNLSDLLTVDEYRSFDWACTLKHRVKIYLETHNFNPCQRKVPDPAKCPMCLLKRECKKVSTK